MTTTTKTITTMAMVTKPTKTTTATAMMTKPTTAMVTAKTTTATAMMTTTTTKYPYHSLLNTVEQVGCRVGHAPPLHWYPPRSGGVSYVLSRARSASEELPPLRNNLRGAR